MDKETHLLWWDQPFFQLANEKVEIVEYVQKCFSQQQHCQQY